MFTNRHISAQTISVFELSTPSSKVIENHHDFQHCMLVLFLRLILPLYFVVVDNQHGHHDQFLLLVHLVNIILETFIIVHFVLLNHDHLGHQADQADLPLSDFVVLSMENWLVTC